jgi:uncharacterized protein (TIRG00374 family)
MNVVSRDWIIVFLQYGIGVALLGWIVYRANWERLIQLLSNISAVTLLAVVVVSVVALVFRIGMWHVILKPISPVSFRDSAIIDLVVNFINQLFPSRLAGRSAAPFVVAKNTNLEIGTATTVVGLNTALYAIVYGVAAVLGTMLAFRSLSLPLFGLLLGSSGLYIAIGIGITFAWYKIDLVNKFLTWVMAKLGGIPLLKSYIHPDKLPKFIDQLTGVDNHIFSSGTISKYIILWLGSLMVFPGVRIWLLFESLGTTFTPVVLLPFYLVAAYSVTLLPLTPGSMGVTEVAAAFVFFSLGVPYEVAVSAVFFDRLFGTYLPALIGWIPTIRMGMGFSGGSTE